MSGTGSIPLSLVALLLCTWLCTCQRWGRVTSKLIAAVEAAGAHDAADLDELAKALSSESVVIECPLFWARPEWLDWMSGRSSVTRGSLSNGSEARRPCQNGLSIEQRGGWHAKVLSVQAFRPWSSTTTARTLAQWRGLYRR